LSKTLGLKNKEHPESTDELLYPPRRDPPYPPVTADIEFGLLQQNLDLYLTDPGDRQGIESAFRFAVEKHKNQKRKSGEDYVTHPIAVAGILSLLKADPSSIIAAILHDVLEDTPTSFQDIETHFGTVVAQLVDGLTKISKFQSQFRSNQERMAENFRKMMIAMAKDLRVILIKIADRLHNMRTIDCLPQEKRQRIAQETLDIYAPLAGRLGIYGLKSELEDLCLRQTKYPIYKDISKKIAVKKKEREAYIEEVKEILEGELTKYGFKHVLVYGRPKHFYSIYKKMIDRHIAFEDIHDLFGFRIIVDTIRDCYEALGVVHAIWKPLPGRFKDYIAMPKANLYQSLHTTVVRPQGMPAEIQIRTYEMHEVCEFGVAAHWAYKEKKDPNLSWLNQMMEIQKDVKNPNEFLNAIKVDLVEEEIFVFTPKGDVIQLAGGSTPLDFAFAVHTDIGLHTVRAKVNGKLSPLKSKIRSGDIVDIMTSHNQKPSKDWLNFVTTSKAKNKIRAFLRSEQKSALPLLPLEQPGKGNQVPQAEQAPGPKKIPSGVLVSGLDHVLVSFGRCCNPLPGEAIVGFITRGRGVSIHREICPRSMDLDPERHIDVSWSEDALSQERQYTAYLRVITQDRPGILSEVASAISAAKGNILRAQIQVSSSDLTGVLDFEVGLSSLKQLEQVSARVEALPDVVLVERRSVERSLLKPFIKGRK
jgi:guanosine-3',5'-bis(diphosphate) 3'-pyrophosphohydrolase